MKGGLLGLPGLTAATIVPERLRPLLAEATTLQGLIDLGVERGFTIWPEWGPTFTHLDKGGQPPRIPGIENRPNPPPAGLVGKRIAFHNGAHVGGRPGSGAFAEGVRAVLATARAAGWEVSSFKHPRGGTFYELRKGGKMVSWDPSWNPLAGGTPIGTASTIGIPRSAITFTAVIAGFEPPTDSPKYPWQFASDPEDSEDWSYGWHVTDVVVLRTPILCAGLQGPWTLAGAMTIDLRTGAHEDEIAADYELEAEAIERQAQCRVAVAAMQWAAEVARATFPGQLSLAL